MEMGKHYKSGFFLSPSESQFISISLVPCLASNSQETGQVFPFTHTPPYQLQGQGWGGRRRQSSVHQKTSSRISPATTFLSLKCLSLLFSKLLSESEKRGPLKITLLEFGPYPLQWIQQNACWLLLHLDERNNLQKKKILKENSFLIISSNFRHRLSDTHESY